MILKVSGCLSKPLQLFNVVWSCLSIFYCNLHVILFFSSSFKAAISGSLFSWKWLLYKAVELGLSCNHTGLFKIISQVLNEWFSHEFHHHMLKEMKRLQSGASEIEMVQVTSLKWTKLITTEETKSPSVFIISFSVQDCHPFSYFHHALSDRGFFRRSSSCVTAHAHCCVLHFVIN